MHSIPHRAYSQRFSCSLAYYRAHERVLTVCAYTLRLGALIAQLIATVAHIQPDEASVFGSPDHTQQLGYLFGFASVVLAGLSSLLPFEQSASQYRHAAAVMARYLVTKEALPRSYINKVYAIDPIFLPSTDFYKACEESGSDSTATPSPRKASTAWQTPNAHASRSSLESQPAIDTAIPFAEHAPLLLCADHGFREYAVWCYRLHYLLVTVQLLFTSSTAVFHGDLTVVLDAPRNDLRFLGIVSGVIGTLSTAAVSVFPLKVAAEQCQHAHAIINEYVLSHDAMPNSVLEHLYGTNTLWMTNPLLAKRCLKVAQA